MTGLANNMKFNVNDEVLVDGKPAIIVDIVDGGVYRVKTNKGTITCDEKDIKPLDTLKEPANDGDENPLNESTLTEGKLMQYAKKFFQKLRGKEEPEEKKELEEGLNQNELEYLVSTSLSIDEYTSKVSQDNITVALFCNEKEVTADLHDFLEKMYFMEIRDIEISDTLTEDNKYILFLELDRTQQFPKILIDIIDSINLLINKDVKDWSFITLGMNKKAPLTEENLRKCVRLVPIQKTIVKDEVKKESVEYSKDGFTRTYLDEGYITDEEFNRCIEKAKELNEGMELDREVLEYNFPTAEVLTTENNAFVINNGKIRKLGF